MRDLHSGDLGLLVGCIDHCADASCICAIATDNADEFFNIVTTDDEHRAAGRSAELGRAESIDILGGVIEFVLDQRHELGVSAFSAVVRVQRDDEIRDVAEPLLYLHLCTGPRPLAHRALRRSCLALADDAATLLAVADDGPEAMSA